MADHGVGMPEEVRRRALEPFFTTKGPRSTGLGLSVAYGTVQRYDGTLDIESAEGRGTMVTVGLPVASEPVLAEAAVDPRPAGKPLRILVIDDEPEVRSTLAELLGADGHRVTEAEGGPEGLDFLASGHEVDLVLTDLGMPVMPGSDVAREIRDRWPTLPVGLVTGRSARDMTEEVRANVHFVISKPIDWASLRQTLAEVGAAS